MQNYDNSVSNLDEELLSILINLQNKETNIEHEIFISIVKSDGMSTKATLTDEGCHQGSFCSETIFNLSQIEFSEIKTQSLQKELDFAPIQKSINF